MAESFVGEVQMFAGNFAPAGWAFCNGQTLNISEYETLFALIGTTYGGDGQATFALPDLRGRLVLHTGGASGPQYVLGQRGGNVNVTLTPANLPPHTHAVRATAVAGTQSSPELGVPAGGHSYATSATATMAEDTVGPAGNTLPFSVQQPVLGVNYIISLFGIYPSQY